MITIVMHKNVTNISSFLVICFFIFLLFCLLHDVDYLANGSEYRLYNEIYLEEFISVHLQPPFLVFPYHVSRQEYFA